ncbi:BSP-domain-containing protein [Xylariaceae sp. FL0662B]|nr:BSP-domain-containing protein [Xylariaceae sp. FL0662B]
MNHLDPDCDLSKSTLHIDLAFSHQNKKATQPSPSMPLPPDTTPVPQPIFLPGISHRTEGPAPISEPTPSPLPVGSKDAGAESPEATHSSSSKEDFDLPVLRLHINDLSHAGASIFLSAINASAVFRTSVRNVQRLLYTSPSTPHTHCPGTRSVTLILRDMDGVAYTTGSDLDDDHKEIHFSLRYIAGLPTSRHTAEITGVITHELVHCYQWNGRGAAPGGLVEGVADWVRLHCDLAPPHWRREAGDRWDGGYQHTAYFLEYLEGRFGEGTVRRLNEKLRTSRYEEKAFWTELVGRPVEQLWEDYKDKLSREDRGKDEKGPPTKTT